MGKRTHARDELRLEDERLALALVATGLGVWERDLSTNRIVWSETMYRLYGRSPEQFSGTADEVMSFVHPQDRADFRRVFEEAVGGANDLFEQEYRIVRPDGEIRWVQRRGQVRRGPDGRPLSVLGVALDITERKQAEETNAWLASIVSAADDAIIGLAPDGTVLAWNTGAERMFGYVAAEMIGQSASVLYPEPAQAEFDSNYARVRGGEAFRAEGMRRTKDGTPIEVAIALSPVFGRHGQVVGVSAVVRNVSERRRTEQKLVETLALLLHTNNQRKLALLAGRMGTFEVDIEHDHITWSDEIYDQVGIDRSTPITTMQDIEPFIHPDDREAVRAKRAAAYQSGRSYENEFRIVRPDGQVRWIHVRAQAFADPGHPARVYGVSMDVTERKEREEHIRFLMSEVAHRSKNMLAVVQAIAAQTARTTRSPSDFAADFGARLKSLASSQDLLVQEEWRGVSARELVRSQLAHHGGPGKARVEMEGPNVMLSPLAAQYLGMALHELSTNAVKYGALSVPGGKVRIEWQLSGPGNARHFHISWLEEGGPAVVPPTEKGFGNLVIERMVADALHGQVTLEYAPAGLRWTLEADVSPAVREPGGAGG